MLANVKHGLILSSGMCISVAQAPLFGLTGLVERMFQELIAKMTELQVDSFELACLRGIILFNPGKRKFGFYFSRKIKQECWHTCTVIIPRFPFIFFCFLDAKGLSQADRVEAYREKLYCGLEEHCRQMHPQDVSRFAKLLLRLPSLRSISLKCSDLLFLSQLFPALPADSFLSRLLQSPTRDLPSIAAEVQEEKLQRAIHQYDFEEHFSKSSSSS